ncbi:MAG: SRPBCC family protein [Bacteroidales bacterium]|nr:SRPBCC family protein [Bacteroidales bacterium]
MLLKRNQHLPITMNEAWEFFSNPKNLKTITPQFMGFDITSDIGTERMYAGMIITYRVSPILNISLKWMTEITHLREPHFFVDNQKSGPFSIWHHQHWFKEVPNGIEMTDIVNYSVGFGLPGRMAEKLIINRRVKEIFDFRYHKLEEIFGKYKA